MIKAIIFDCYGVLATDGWLPFKEKHFGKDKKLFEEAGELNRQADSGFITVGNFIKNIAEMSGVSKEEVKEDLEHNMPNDKIFDFIKNLKPKYRLGILSNSGSNALHRIFTEEQIKLFDAIALSYEMGVTKPQPEAYEIIAEKLGLEPGECVFIDDQERYANAAKEVGMKAVWYQNFEQMKGELEQILSS